MNKSRKILFFISSALIVLSGLIVICMYFKNISEREIYYVLNWQRTISQIVNVDTFICENENSNYRFENFNVCAANPLLERDRGGIGGRCIVALFSCDYISGNAVGTCIFELLVNVDVLANPGRLKLVSPYVDKITCQSDMVVPKEVEMFFRQEITKRWQGEVVLNDLSEKDNKNLLIGAFKLRKDGIILRVGGVK